MFTRKTFADPTPCMRCNGTELRILHDLFQRSNDEFWVYELPCHVCCDKCDKDGTRRLWRNYPSLRPFCCESPYKMAQVPIRLDIVGSVERAVESSKVSTGGSDYRAHGHFVSALSLLSEPERVKQSLIRWVPYAMLAFERNQLGVARKLRTGHLTGEEVVAPSSPTLEPSASPKPTGEAKGPPNLEQSEEAAKFREAAVVPANNDCDGSMLGTQVDSNAYGEETRVKGISLGPADSKILGIQVGPSVIETEVMESCESNLKAGLAKRVKPLPFKKTSKEDKNMIRKIEKTVTTLLETVFTEEKIKHWRMENPMFDEMHSKKWSSDRWRNAVEEALAEVGGRIEQTFQIKVNEALPAKGKAPRPIIQCGDKAQAMMALPVRCFEELLFEFFEGASIKHLPKHDAMKRAAKRLRKNNAKFGNIIEGDGSAWDSCCNPTIRGMTENRIMRHIIAVLGNDPEVPESWLKTVVEDMEKMKIKGKAKVSDQTLTPIRVVIESIRQSGHRGTSCFNYLINLVCWLCVVCDKPWTMISKDERTGELQTGYVSAHDGKWYHLTYMFEGDDSAICSTEDFRPIQHVIEDKWTRMGFRMKLVFVDKKLTFTGFEFLCDAKGTTGVFVPEIPRNIASASWSCSSELKSDPTKRYRVGAAAMLARAENFKDCGPFSRYFAALGLAHVARVGDMALDEVEAMRLGIAPVDSVRKALVELYENARVCEGGMKKLVDMIVPMTDEQMVRLTHVHFDDPFDHVLARQVLPFSVWDPRNFEKARRPNNM